jgi:hypothetical protein
LQDEDRRDELRREGDRLRGAVLANLAFHDGKALEREMRKYDRALATPVGGGAAVDDPVIRRALSDALTQLRDTGRRRA